MIEVIGAIVTGGVAVFAAVYAVTRDTVVKLTKENLTRVLAETKETTAGVVAEKNEWKARHEADRKEIHSIREQWNHDRLELERLRVETNFSPIEQKLNLFMDTQNKFNGALVDRLDSMTNSQERLTTQFIVLMEKLVPEISKEEADKQEQPI